MGSKPVIQPLSLSPTPHLLDTQAWIWFFEQNPRARKLASSLPIGVRLTVSAITIWEAAMLEAKGRVSFHPDLDTRVRITLGVACELVPLLPEIAIASTRLDKFHNDPADRIIVATALHTNAVLVTADAKILAWAKSTGRLKTMAL